MGDASTTRVLAAGVGIGGFLLVATACLDDDGVAGSGTGGDDRMPDDPSPGPSGPGCGERVERPARPSGLAAEPRTTEVSQVVELPGETMLDDGQRPSPSAIPSDGATTQAPHIHEGAMQAPPDAAPVGMHWGF